MRDLKSYFESIFIFSLMFFAATATLSLTDSSMAYADFAPVCPTDSSFNPVTDMCENISSTLPTCAVGTFNEITDQCEDSEIPVCPGSLNFNPVSDKCERTGIVGIPTCPDGSIFSGGICQITSSPTCPDDFTFDSLTNLCESNPVFFCPSGTILNTTLDLCEGNPVPTCDSSFQLNTATDQCESISRPDTVPPRSPICPADFTYNSVTDLCDGAVSPSCPFGMIYNTSTDLCEGSISPTCPSGFIFDIFTDMCQLSISPTCPSGFAYNSVTDSCEGSISPICSIPGGILNTSTDLCEGSSIPSCGRNQLNTVTDLCEGPVPSFTPSCSSNLTYNPVTDLCDGTISPSCPLGLVYDNTSNLCEGSPIPSCPTGTQLTTSTDLCEGSPAPICSTGIFDTTTNLCTAVIISENPICPLNFVYMSSTDLCQIISTPTCDVGTFNSVSNNCELIINSVPTCPANSVFDSTLDICLDIDSDEINPGDILVPDTNALGFSSPAVFKIDPLSGIRTIFSDFTDSSQGPTSRDAQGITIDSSGNVWVVSPNHDQFVARGALFKLDLSTGDRTLVSDFAEPLQGPLGIQPFRVAVDSSGNVLVTDHGPDSSSVDTFLFKIDPVTGFRTILSDFGDIAQGPEGRVPFNIAVDSSGNILVADFRGGVASNGLIFSIDPVTGVRTIVSDFQIPAGFPTGNLPHGLAVDSSGNLIATTLSGGTNGKGLLLDINPITGDRTIINDFGDIAQGPEAFSSERAVAINSAGDYLVVDEKAGPNGLGLLFEIDHITGARTILSDFENSLQGQTGMDPFDVAIVPIILDTDGDGVPDVNDNCPLISNPEQEGDNEGHGDACTVNLMIEKTGPLTVLRGDSAVFTTTIFTKGPAAIPEFTIVDTFPFGFTFDLDASLIANPSLLPTDITIIDNSDGTQTVTYQLTADDVPTDDPLTWTKIDGAAWIAVAPEETVSGPPTDSDTGNDALQLSLDVTNTASVQISTVFFDPDPSNNVDNFDFTLQSPPTGEKFIDPELQENLTDKMKSHFQKKINHWEDRITKLENKITKLDSSIQKATEKGQTDKVNRLTANAADKQDKIEILSDMIAVLKISLGQVTPDSIPVELQDNLLLKSIENIEKRINHWDSKIWKLNERADNLDSKAATLVDKSAEKRAQGKDKQADRLEERAGNLVLQALALRDKADTFEDLNEVLKCAIDFQGESIIDESVDPEDDSEGDSMFS